jgi:hypothetical protein
MTLTFGSPHARKNLDNHAKTEVVVAVICIVPIAIRRTTVVRVVVPRAATLWICTFSSFLNWIDYLHFKTAK